MRRGLALVAAVAAVATGLTVPVASSARNAMGCPDDMILFPSSATTRDKDKNGDGSVCVKPISPDKAQTDNKDAITQDGVTFFLEDVIDNELP